MHRGIEELWTLWESKSKDNQLIIGDTDTPQGGMYLTKTEVNILFKEIRRRNNLRTPNARATNVISDDLGVQGVLNPATGKIHDSKSAYYKDVKESGCVIVGNDAPREAKGPKAEIDVNDIKKDINDAYNQLGC